MSENKYINMKAIAYDINERVIINERTGKGNKTNAIDIIARFLAEFSFAILTLIEFSADKEKSRETFIRALNSIIDFVKVMK